MVPIIVLAERNFWPKYTWYNIFQTSFLDSKTLTEEQREELFEKIDKAQDTIGFIVEILSPAYISNSLLRR